MTRFLPAALAALIFTGSADAQLFRRTVTVGGCPNGQCPTAGVAVQAVPAPAVAVTSSTLTYSTVLTRVQAGEVIVAGFGVPATVTVTEVPVGILPGVYRCFMFGGKPSMERHVTRTVTRTRSNHWTFPGAYTREGIAFHLATTHHIPVSVLGPLSFEELMSLHDADHEGRR